MLDESIQELASRSLARIAAAGVRCAYVRADVTDARAVQGAVAEAEHRLGPVTALLHGAGSNTPQLISALDEEAIQRTLAPKTQGLRNVLAALDTNRLRLLVTFGSIIARAGLRGEADYALANASLGINGVVLTNPHIGNYGTTPSDAESARLRWVHIP